MSRAYAVSADGSTVVGESLSANGTESFRWTASGGMVGLGDLAGGTFYSRARGVSGDGSVIVGEGRSASGVEAYRWTAAGGMAGLGDLPGGIFESDAEDVSDDGTVIVGRSRVSGDYRAFRWTASGGMVSIGELPGGGAYSAAYAVSNDGNTIVGQSQSDIAANHGYEAFQWTASGGMIGLGDFAGRTTGSVAYGISADGMVVVGNAGRTAGTSEAFRWTPSGGLAGLGTLYGAPTSTTALDVSADGSVIVGYGQAGPTGTVYPFIWDQAHGLRDLSVVLTNDYGLNLSGWSNIVPWGISADGSVIVGQADGPHGGPEAWMARLDPDLQINSAVAYGNNQIDLTYTIANTASQPFDVGFYTSADASYGAGDSLVKMLSITSPADLTVGTHVKTFAMDPTGLPIPGYQTTDLDQDYYLLAVLDPANTINEPDADPIAEDNSAILTGTYHPAGGPLYIQGGEGVDTIALSVSGSNLIVNFNGSPRVYAGGASGDVSTIRIRSHGGNDSLNTTALGRPVQLWAGDGNDLVTTGSAADVINGGLGNDSLSGGGGNDTIFGGAGDDQVIGGAGNDVLEGGIGNDLVDGGTGNDTIYAGWEADTTSGGAGNDTLIGSNSHNIWTVDGFNTVMLNSNRYSSVESLTGDADQDDFFIQSSGLLTGKIDGKGGVNSIDFSQYFAPVTVNLQSKSATGVAAFTNLQWLIGSTSYDTLFGPNISTKWTITGSDAGTAGAMNFGSFENLVGGTGADTFKFNDGKNVNGVIDGGDGVNVVDYSLWTTGVNINLTTSTATAVGGGITSIQNVTGGAGADTIVGDDDSNTLIGNAGDDTISGGIGGDDILLGGIGNDALTGSVGGNNILVGGDGNDTLNASQSGRSLLIGGRNNDMLTGSAFDDLLIAGYTSFDTNTNSLKLILGEWKRTDVNYTDRVAHLRGTLAGGNNGTTYLTTSTIRDDAATDTVNGAGGQDWFWGLPAEAVDRAIDELLN